MSLNLMSRACLRTMGGSITEHDLRRCVNGISNGKSGTLMSSMSKSLMASSRSSFLKPEDKLVAWLYKPLKEKERVFIAGVSTDRSVTIDTSTAGLHHLVRRLGSANRSQVVTGTRDGHGRRVDLHGVYSAHLELGPLFTSRIIWND